jgi:ADP-ribose pyrophosphatase YjhB (NUDIX family)
VAPGQPGLLARAIKEADMLDNLRRCAEVHDEAVAQYGRALARLWSSGSETPDSGGLPGCVGVPGFTVKGVCSDDDTRVLLCLNHRGEWELPGGRPNPGESYPDCLTREIQEETGLHTAVRSLLTAYPYEVLPGRWVHVLVYGCDLRDPASVQHSAEHRAVDFFSASELEELPVPTGTDAISGWLGPSER